MLTEQSNATVQFCWFTNTQAHIILLWTHSTTSLLFGENADAGKGGRNEKKSMTSSKVSRLSYSGNGTLLEDLKDHVRARLS